MEDGSSWLLTWALGHRPKHRFKKGKSETSSFVPLNLGISSTISMYNARPNYGYEDHFFFEWEFHPGHRGVTLH